MISIKLLLKTRAHALDAVSNGVLMMENNSTLYFNTQLQTHCVHTILHDGVILLDKMYC